MKKKGFIISILVAITVFFIFYFFNSGKKESKKPSVANNVKGAVIELSKKSINFGTLAKDSTAEFELFYYNRGSEPLLISKVRTSCGCTIAKYDKTPVMPGDSGIVILNLETDKTGGYLNKKVAIYSNAINDVDTSIQSSRVICTLNWAVSGSTKKIK